MSERAVIFDIRRFSIHDGPGIRTTVFFKGCPLHCWWCHNPESWRMCPQKFQEWRGNARAKNRESTIGREVSKKELIKEIESDVSFYDESGGGVTFSGGEPLCQVTFLESILKACHEIGINTAVDTSGYVKWVDLKRVIPFTDIFLFDLKVMDPDLHRVYTGVSNRSIHENLKRLHDSGANIFLRIPLIPGITDSTSNLDMLVDFIKGIGDVSRIDLLPYNPASKEKHERFHRRSLIPDSGVQSDEELDSIRNRFSHFSATVTLRG